jgi:hypothetical protein
MTIHFFDLGISIADSEPQPLDAYVQSEMRAQLRIRTRKRTCRRLAHNRQIAHRRMIGDDIGPDALVPEPRG